MPPILETNYPFAFAGPKPIMDPKDRYYHQIQAEIDDIQNRIAHLASVSVVAGERQDAADSVLAAISKLELSVADAYGYIPAYDQERYGDTVKKLRAQVADEMSRLAPKSRFRFKRTNPSAPTSAAQSDPRLLRGVPSAASASASSSAIVEEPDSVGALPSFSTTKNYNAEMAKKQTADSSRPGSNLRKPSFSAAREVAISGHEGLHIVLPLSASRATSSGSLTDMHSCVVDMSVPTSNGDTTGGGSAFLSLMIQNVDRSLVVAGHVNGPVHITGVRDSIVVVLARQVRVHECHNVDLYLYCGSRPIIEDCANMRFAPIPACYMNADEDATHNQWDQVDDFKWLKTEHSPNWSVLPEAERLPEKVWKGAVAGSLGYSTEEVLKAVGIAKG